MLQLIGVKILVNVAKIKELVNISEAKVAPDIIPDSGKYCGVK